MSVPNVSISSTRVMLESAPISRYWIIEGSPQAKNKVLFKSHDGTAWTMIWECTAGVFDWIYDCDETIQILDGQVSLTTDSGTRELRAGDAVFFPAGSRATWHVDSYVRKIAFLREALPSPLGMAIRTLRKMRMALGKRGVGAGGLRPLHPSA